MKGVYLICAGAPLPTGVHPRHYIGYSGDLADRILAHRCGRGARLLQVFEEYGILWDVVRVWEGKDRSFERHLKNQKNAKRHCPNCTPSVINKMRER